MCIISFYLTSMMRFVLDESVALELLVIIPLPYMFIDFPLYYSFYFFHQVYFLYKVVITKFSTSYT